MTDELDFWKNRALEMQGVIKKSMIFRRAYDDATNEAEYRSRKIWNDTSANLERLAVSMFGNPNPSKGDDFAPPKTPVQVECLHCGEKYSSSEMRLEYRPIMQHPTIQAFGEIVQGLSPLWWCKNALCDGAGFGFDIHEVRQKGKPKGRVKRKDKAVEETP